jgi:hypothetical protein
MRGSRACVWAGPGRRGWQCARFSKFPQELVLRLDHPARIHQIQLLSHEYKIATKIELYTGLLPPGETSLDRAVMRRLGHLSFDANTASGHQAGVRVRSLHAPCLRRPVASAPRHPRAFRALLIGGSSLVPLPAGSQRMVAAGCQLCVA